MYKVGFYFKSNKSSTENESNCIKGKITILHQLNLVQKKGIKLYIGTQMLLEFKKLGHLLKIRSY